MFNFLTKKKESGQVVLEEVLVAPTIDKEALFKEAVKRAAVSNLANQIEEYFNEIHFGKEVVEQTELAILAESKAISFKEIKEKYPKAYHEYGSYGFPALYRNLAHKFAKKVLADV